MVSTPRRTPATRPARDLPRRVRTDKANRTLALEAFPDAVLQSMCPLLLWGRRRPKNQSPLARAMCGTDRPVAQAQIDLSIPARACPLLSRLGLLDINSFPASSRDLCQRARGGALPFVYTEEGHPYTLFSPCACEASEAILPVFKDAVFAVLLANLVSVEIPSYRPWETENEPQEPEAEITLFWHETELQCYWRLATHSLKSQIPQVPHK